MALIKTPEEIALMRQGGALLSKALVAAVAAVKPGITMAELDAIAEEVIVTGGGKPSFKGYKTGGAKPFPSTLCISRNDEVVHGLGNRSIVLEAGDIVGLDIGCWYEGLCTDMAVTVPVGKVDPELIQMLQVTRESMRAGVAAARAGGTVLDIGRAVEEVVKPYGYGIVRDLVGHGVGHAVHESPNVPNYVAPGFSKATLPVGACLAIEPMLTMGGEDLEILEDGWTLVTADGSEAGHFEVTIALTEAGVEVLTPEPEVPGI
jgi:methionyl aminopeptidase